MKIRMQINIDNFVPFIGRAVRHRCDFAENRGIADQHIQAPEEAERMVERGREIFGTEPVAVSEIGPVIGTHTGPGLLGVAGLSANLLR